MTGYVLLSPVLFYRQLKHTVHLLIVTIVVVTQCVNSVHNMYNVFSSILDSVACSKYIEITWNDGHKNTLFEADIVIIAEKYSKCHVMCKELQCRMQF